METFNRIISWKIIRYTVIAVGVLGIILLFTCFGVLSSVTSISSDNMSAAFGSLSSIYSSINNLSSIYSLDFFFLLVITILAFLKMKSTKKMDYKPGYFLIASLCAGLLCEFSISSINDGLSNIFTSSMTSLASSVQLFAIFVLLMAILEIIGGVIGYRTQIETKEKISSFTSMAKLNENSLDDFISYMLDSKLDIMFSINEEGKAFSKELNLPDDYTREDIIRSLNQLDFFKKRQILQKFKEMQ